MPVLDHEIDLKQADIAGLTSADAIATILDRFGYAIDARKTISTEAAGISESGHSIQNLELLSEDPDGFLDIYLAELKSITVKARTMLVSALGKRNRDHLLILTGDYSVLEFVLIVKERRDRRGPIGGIDVVPRHRSILVDRRSPRPQDLRVLRQFTFTRQDGLDQYDKLKVVFEAAEHSSRFFVNRALFSDYFLENRLRDLDAWGESPNATFDAVRAVVQGRRDDFKPLDRKDLRSAMFEPLWKALGFSKPRAGTKAGPKVRGDALLRDDSGASLVHILIYPWHRWLDGPDPDHDSERPTENPGAAVVSLLDQDDSVDWAIVTNGKIWRLYSSRTHSRSTNYFEVDLEEALAAGDGTDPNEAFRYWWLFFRAAAFQPAAKGTEYSWLDMVVNGSRDYAREVEKDLKLSVFQDIVPSLAQGFLSDRRSRLGNRKKPTPEELETIRQATLTMLYRLLFLLYAESRDLLPSNELAYDAISLKSIKKRIALAGGGAPTERDAKLKKTFGTKDYSLYQSLQTLFETIAEGNANANVPKYNGGLFIINPESADHSRDAEIARFLSEHRIPDCWLALALDDLARVEDERLGHALVFIDYKSLGVRHLGSIYEGLLEFKFAIATEDLTVRKVKGREIYSSYAEALAKGGRSEPPKVKKKGELYLTNDKAERKASGSYYTPDHIVQYIVEHAVGPVLHEKLESLRDEFRKAERTYATASRNATNDPRLLKTSLKDPIPTGDEVLPRVRDFATQRVYDKHRELFELFFDLKVLDPAMGSGHFLVDAVDFITDKMLNFLNEFPHNPISTALNVTRKSIIDSLREQHVEVDENRLTEVNLLKRHVLKRCIYGVDLNPLASELAKVSLWLNAFTLGAPLSFLDHHLRCGNSLKGAWLTDLSQLAGGTFFGIDYDEPLQRALKGLLAIATLSDATAAEVHRSSHLHSVAVESVSGIQCIMSLLVAQYFGYADAALIVKEGSHYVLTSRQTLIDSMTHDDRQLLVAAEEICARQHFFHWELEFPEVFFTLGSAVGVCESTQQLLHLPADQRGFDAIVGNPPWGDWGDVSALSNTRTFESVSSDLAEAFVCLAMELTKRGGHIGQILPDTLLSPAKSEIRRTMLTKVTTRALFNIGPDWFTVEVRMAAILWHASRVGEKGTRFFSCILPIEARKAAQEGAITLEQAIADSKRVVNPALCRSDELVSIPMFGSESLSALFARLTDKAPTMGELCDYGRGVELNKAGQVVQCSNCEMWDAPPATNAKRKCCSHCGESYVVDESTNTRTLVSYGRRPANKWRPYMMGEDIHRYQPPKLGWIDPSATGVNYKEESLYRSPKLFIRQAGIGINAIADLEASAMCPQSVYIYRVREYFRQFGYDECVLLGYLSSRIFHLQVFMEFGEIDSSRAFSKLTHQRLAQLRVITPSRMRLHRVATEQIGALVREIIDGQCDGADASDWRIEGLWSVVCEVRPSDIREIVSAFARVHENEVLLRLFPGGIGENVTHWERVWVDAIRIAAQDLKS